MVVVVVLACVIAAIFAALGVAKILALASMRELAAKVGFTPNAYRGIGVLEVAGAVGVALGPVVPLLGGLAGAGLVLLLAGAVVTHLRHQHGPREFSPALVCAVLVAGYLVALFWLAS
ncbi:hypothetical protein F4561_001429 [Lipingzhangella halophila]|uniref:DoxX-like protein n=1 Tax=Lipingzhangella halophila TaxID=1783352 RepID=A0A7W7REV7_9ACTN|nr:DoxX family protein [Lipingzhangella halophila]MBB4930609.1 hypothetical protein [Lipingzhangella halophila]